MKIICLLLCIVAVPFGGTAQGFQKIYGSNLSNGFNVINDDIESIKTSDNGYLLVGEKVLKVDTAGVVQWGASYDGKFKDVIEDNGAYIATGIKQGQLYVLKMDSIGAVVWSKSYVISIGGSDQGNAIKKIVDGYIIAGRSIKFGYEPILMKIDFSGNLIWQQLYRENQRTSSFKDIEVLADGSFIVTGWTNQTGGGSNFHDVLAMRLAQNGDILWTREFVGNTSSFAYEVCKGPANTLLLSGSTGINEAPDNKGLLMSLDQSGNLIYSKSYETDGDTQFLDVSYNATSNEIFVTGEADANAVESKYQTILYKMDATGNLISAKKYGKVSQVESGNSLLIDGNSIVISGVAFDIQESYYITKADFSGDAIRCLQFDASPVTSTVPFVIDPLPGMIKIVGTPPVSSNAEVAVSSPFTELDRLLSVTVDFVENDCNYSGTGKIVVTSSGANDFGFYIPNFDGVNQLVTDVLTIDNITAGQHILIVTANQECTFTDTITIDNSPAPFTIDISNVNTSCHGQSTGSATASSDNNFVFFEWSTGIQSANLNNVSAGNYEVYVEDPFTSCRDTASVNISEYDLISVTSPSITHVSSCSSTNGSITFSANGAPGDTFQYSVNGQPGINTSGSFTGLGYGEYALVATSVQSQCSVLGDTVKIEGNDPAPVFELFVDTVCADQQGIVYRVANNPALSYSWLLPVGSEITSGEGTNEIAVNFTSFVGGTLGVFTASPSGCSSDTLFLPIVANNSAGNYGISNLQVQCEQTDFSIPIEGSPTLTDVLGIDFCMEYDQNIITPTGTATIGEVVNQGSPNYANYYLNTATPGIIYGVIYYTAQAPFPTFLNGNGLIIDIDYTLNAGVPAGTTTEITLCGITEGTLTSGSVEGCSGLTSSINVVSNPEFVGNIAYWNKAGRPLRYDSMMPGANLITEISGTDQFCNPVGYAVLPDTLGYFEFNTDSAQYLRISRDIPGEYGSLTNCTNVMTLINGADQNRALKIATLDPSFVPSVYQIMAADVNLDGVISALDVTLMSARSVMSICGFPNNGTGSSIDWVFIAKSSVDTLASYQISGLYPAEDGIGYSKNNIPVSPLCFEIPINSGPLCVETGTEEYAAILLGDISGNWVTADGSNARKSAIAKELVLNFDRAFEKDNQTFIPVYYNFNETVNAVDFHFKIAQDMRVVDVKIAENAAYQSLQRNWNLFNQTDVLFSSFSLNDLPENGKAMYLVLDGMVISDLSDDWIESGKAFINGTEVDFNYGTNLTTATMLLNDSPFIKVYPNPVTDIIGVKLMHIGEFKIDLMSTDGKLKKAYGNYNNQEIELSTEGIASGVYILTISNDQIRYQEKVIISQ